MPDHLNVDGRLVVVREAKGDRRGGIGSGATYRAVPVHYTVHLLHPVVARFIALGLHYPRYRPWPSVGRSSDLLLETDNDGLVSPAATQSSQRSLPASHFKSHHRAATRIRQIDGTTYQELGPNYFDERDKEQVIRRCTHRIEQLGKHVTVTDAA